MTSTFRFSRSGSVFESATSQEPQSPIDLITFLEVAQSLDVDFLPVTWQSALERIGSGATSEIRESLLSLNDSFAFKRAIPFGIDTIGKRILPFLIAEISILSHRSVRDHPNINQLQGVCWEVYSSKGHPQVFSRDRDIDSTTSGIIPVLVFEKTVHGDLHQFMTAGEGRELSLSERLHLCTDIAQAIADMHSNSKYALTSRSSPLITDRYNPW